MFYDHFLARDFERYAPVPLADFLDTARERMLEAWHVLTPRLQASMERLMPLTWMVNYAVPDGISYAVDRLAHRVRTDIGLAGGGEELMRNYEGFDEDFKAFFAEMMAYVESLRGPRTW